MKIAVNETRATIVLAQGRLRLDPKGSATDRKEIPDDIAAQPDVQRFIEIRKISLLSAEEAANRESREKKAKLAAAAKLRTETEAKTEAKTEAEVAVKTVKADAEVADETVKADAEVADETVKADAEAKTDNPKTEESIEAEGAVESTAGAGAEKPKKKRHGRRRS